jgi:hypothetical protein
MKYIAMATILLATFLSSGCRKSDTPAPVPSRPFHVRVIDHFSSQPLRIIPISVDKSVFNPFRGTFKQFYGLQVTDHDGYISLPGEWTYELTPFSDSLWNPDKTTNPNFFDTTREMTCRLLPLTPLLFKSMDQDSILLSIEVSLPDSLGTGPFVGPFTYPANTIYDSIYRIPLTTGMENKVKLNATLKDGTNREVIYQIHPTDHQLIQITLPF